MTTFSRLFKALHQAQESPPKKLGKAIRSLPPVGDLPSPRETWLLMTLFAQRQRQLWARQELALRLPSAVPPSDKLRTLEQPVETSLPGDSPWSVSLECNVDTPFADLRHRETGEVITADISDDGICPMVFVDKLLREARPTSYWEPVVRLRELYPWAVDADWFDPVVEASLRRSEFVEDYFYTECHRGTGVHGDGLRLTTTALQYANLVQDFCKLWRQTTNRLWIAVLIGDWMLAADLVNPMQSAKLKKYLSKQAVMCRDRWEAVKNRNPDWAADDSSSNRCHVH